MRQQILTGREGIVGKKGLVIEDIDPEGKIQYASEIWNAKTNGELALICASDFYYTDKAPAGQNGARFRNTFSGQDKHGVTIRLAPGETLELVVQDDLTLLSVFNMMAQGHFVTD